MSIQAEIAARVAEGRLTELVIANSLNSRRILMTSAVVKAVDGPWATRAEGRLFGQTRARMEGFVQGDLIVARMPPSKNVNTLIALLAPARDNVWEFRIGDPRPGVRIFGRFAERDLFIATNWGARHLLGDNPRKWRNEMVSCTTEWRTLFPAYQPLSGKTIHDYIRNSRLPV